MNKLMEYLVAHGLKEREKRSGRTMKILEREEIKQDRGDREFGEGKKTKKYERNQANERW